MGSILGFVNWRHITRQIHYTLWHYVCYNTGEKVGGREGICLLKKSRGERLRTETWNWGFRKQDTIGKEYVKKSTVFIMSFNLAPPGTPPSPRVYMGRVSNYHTERRKTKKERNGRYYCTLRGGGGGARWCSQFKRQRHQNKLVLYI